MTSACIAKPEQRGRQKWELRASLIEAVILKPDRYLLSVSSLYLQLVRKTGMVDTTFR